MLRFLRLVAREGKNVNNRSKQQDKNIADSAMDSIELSKNTASEGAISRGNGAPDPTRVAKGWVARNREEKLSGLII